MPNPKGYQDSIKNSQFKAAWQSGPTRTIRVPPIALANATLEYARQLDKKNKPRDTADSSGDSEVGKKQPQSRDTNGSIDEVKRLKGECKRLQNLVSDMRIELYHTPPIPSPPEIELPEAADLLNRLKAKCKKSAVTLADMEAILEMIEEQTPKGN